MTRLRALWRYILRCTAAWRARLNLYSVEFGAESLGTGWRVQFIDNGIVRRGVGFLTTVHVLGLWVYYVRCDGERVVEDSVFLDRNHKNLTWTYNLSREGGEALLVAEALS